MVRKVTFKPIAAALLVILLCSCSTISQKQAEDTAKEFVKSRVVFFTRQTDAPETVQNYEINVVSSTMVGKEWHIALEASTDLNNTVKQNTMQVVVSTRGKVISFNGQPAK
ncbi:MAG: hypothetical protein ABIF10_03950 [Candidatus Woesearchaeota archaeon]